MHQSDIKEPHCSKFSKSQKPFPRNLGGIPEGMHNLSFTPTDSDLSTFAEAEVLQPAAWSAVGNGRGNRWATNGAGRWAWLGDCCSWECGGDTTTNMMIELKRKKRALTGRNQKKCFQGGKGAMATQLWSTINFNRPEKGAGFFSPPQIFGLAKTYRQVAIFAAFCGILRCFAANWGRP